MVYTTSSQGGFYFASAISRRCFCTADRDGSEQCDYNSERSVEGYRIYGLCNIRYGLQDWIESHWYSGFFSTVNGDGRFGKEDQKHRFMMFLDSWSEKHCIRIRNSRVPETSNLKPEYLFLRAHSSWWVLNHGYGDHQAASLASPFLLLLPKGVMIVSP